MYIPYFVLDEIESDDQARIDGMKHFCFLPGIINADKVVVNWGIYDDRESYAVDSKRY